MDWALFDQDDVMYRKIPEAYGIKGGPHLLATCRRGEDPRRCVTDSHGEPHEIRNLFIVDGSSLPSSVSVDPSLTIMAFASQTAEYVNRRLG
jgi:choline dehydrogenase-like flavoprotein